MYNTLTSIINSNWCSMMLHNHDSAYHQHELISHNQQINCKCLNWFSKIVKPSPGWYGCRPWPSWPVGRPSNARHLWGPGATPVPKKTWRAKICTLRLHQTWRAWKSSINGNLNRKITDKWSMIWYAIHHLPSLSVKNRRWYSPLFHQWACGNSRCLRL